VSSWLAPEKRRRQRRLFGVSRNRLLGPEPVLRCQGVGKALLGLFHVALARPDAEVQPGGVGQAEQFFECPNHLTQAHF
jgi:hypothetical protein